MKIKELNQSERYHFYYTFLCNDFHSSEVKKFELIETLINDNKYLCLGFFIADTPIGYAYFIKSDNSTILMLDYFAVIKSFRSKGYGSVLLEKIKEEFKSKYSLIIAEVENPVFSSNSIDRYNRSRRIKFYQRNGLRLSGISSRVFTDEYRIIYTELNQKISDNEIAKILRQFYLIALGPESCEKHITIRLDPS